MKLLFNVLLMIVLCHPGAFAGGDTLGNGGGDAELMFLNTLSRIDSAFQYCASKENPCQLNSEDFSMLAKLISLKGSTDYGAVKFIYEGEPWEFKSEQRFGANIVINQAYLYTSFGFPISVSAMIDIILQINFYQMGLSFEEAKKAANKISTVWKVPPKEFSGIHSGSTIIAVVHEGSFFNFYIWFRQYFYDVTKSFLEAVKCDVKPTSLKILSGNFEHLATRFVLTGKVRYTCQNGITYSARYQVVDREVIVSGAKTEK